ncbi:hypothetical protein ACLK17_01935 [Escherichia coli]
MYTAESRSNPQAELIKMFTASTTHCALLPVTAFQASELAARVQIAGR